MHSENVDSFDAWRTAARRLLVANVSPSDVQWTDDAVQPTLFDSDATPNVKAAPFSVPKTFLELAQEVACHRDSKRWSLLYRTLWRLKNGEPDLLKITTDDDVYILHRMQKAVSRDVHKMKAFVRFRKVSQIGEAENYVAWHRPDHRIVHLTAPFFARRFKGMNWSILTPDESVTWDQDSLRYGPGVSASEAPDDDALEELWKTYYASIFNPARVKVAMMKREMPVRHWPTLPEASLIPDLLHQASARVATMIDKYEGFAETATNYMPETIDLESLRHAAQRCRACDLCHHATQTVFGDGPANARIVLVGEQPGDREDIEGHPFVGPAGQLLNDALSQAGIDRSQIYITNIVKHFKFTEQETTQTDVRGKRRIHQKPNSREIYACRPWLEAELSVIKPDSLVCLGSTPAQALFGRDFRISKDRGTFIATDWCERTMATWHPAAILRMPDEHRQAQMRDQLVADLSSL
ncbi:UdgX family uracil-DNA binding protein [Stieleria varia]|uniref:Type-4 uracil-DNA glycosylase n=1 Tax=Stieleria varia TaxID=2528005 RepID=A0A5C6ARL2_9BACT|nr:UdgX family uracil-DNA binding protein [Stieleria varia]TWU02605.1 Uracil DNA glycosylase superfamily protein [Stieleria varia]